MKTKLTLALTSAMFLASTQFAVAEDRNAAIDGCETAIGEKVGSEEAKTKLKRIKDKGQNVLLKFTVKYTDGDGAEVRQIAECLSKNDGEIVDLSFR